MINVVSNSLDKSDTSKIMDSCFALYYNHDKNLWIYRIRNLYLYNMIRFFCLISNVSKVMRLEELASTLLQFRPCVREPGMNNACF